jgi:hypothetical protein
LYLATLNAVPWLVSHLFQSMYPCIVSDEAIEVTTLTSISSLRGGYLNPRPFVPEAVWTFFFELWISFYV